MTEKGFKEQIEELREILKDYEDREWKERRLILVLSRKKDPIYDNTYAVYFEDFSNKLLNFEHVDFIVIPSEPPQNEVEALLYAYYTNKFGFLLPANADVIANEKKILWALERGKIVCFIVKKPNVLVSRLLTQCKVKYRPIITPLTNIQVKVSEFYSFVNKFCVAYTYFNDLSEEDAVICTCETGIVGFSKRFKGGTLIFLPYITSDEDSVIKTLCRSLIAYSVKIQSETPGWIKDFKLPDDAKIQKLEEDLHNLESTNFKLRSVLCFKANALIDSVMFLLGKMGFATERHEQYEEDFWILDNGKREVIVEVKSKSANLQREDLTKLDEHRDGKALPKDFPALMIVNSFNNANSLKDKDKPISPNEIKKAVRNNILIVRTLDLLNFYNFLKASELGFGLLLDMIKTKKGWMTVKNGEDIVVEK